MFPWIMELLSDYINKLQIFFSVILYLVLFFFFFSLFDCMFFLIVEGKKSFWGATKIKRLKLFLAYFTCDSIRADFKVW